MVFIRETLLQHGHHLQTKKRTNPRQPARQTDKAPQGERETQTGRFMEIEKKSSTAAASTSRDGDRAIYADNKVPHKERERERDREGENLDR